MVHSNLFIRELMLKRTIWILTSVKRNIKQIQLVPPQHSVFTVSLMTMTMTMTLTVTITWPLTLNCSWRWGWRMWTRILINCLFLNLGKASAQVVPDQYPALTAGDNLTLTCNVNEETINVTWKKDGDSPPERAKIDTRFDDEKSTFVYSCEARNKLGFVANSFVKINVKGELVLLLCA